MTAATIIEAPEFVEEAKHCPVVDVRSPAEYKRGHIPGAVSIPLFSDEERAQVGTLYKRHGRQVALLKGLDFAGPKMSDFIRAAKKAGASGEVLLYCWRGGMRSESMAWLFGLADLKPFVLRGGYRSYRRFAREKFTREFPVIILGGMTGSGKTAILRKLEEKEQQVIDLEGLAKHKGSVFGGLEEEVQPTTEHFENLLADKILQLDTNQPVWMEDESLNVGHTVIPMPLYERMQKAPIVIVEKPQSARIRDLVEEYGKFDAQKLKNLIGRISRRLGSEKAGQACLALDNGDVAKSIELVLSYYDKAYNHKIMGRNPETVHRIEFFSEDTGPIADNLIREAQRLSLIL